MVKGDANDYSRFNNIDDDDEEEVTQSKSAALNAQSVQTLLTEAHKLKDTGNEQFKQGKIKESKQSYEDAINVFKDYKTDKTLPSLPHHLQPEVKSLLVSLYGNLAMVAVKEESWYLAITQANHALALDPSNVKCLYRRGLAHFRVSEYQQARADFTRLLEIEPTNIAAKKELASLIQAQKAHKQREKSSFGNIFAKEKAGVYDDREQERAKKIAEREEREREEKEQWKQSNLARLEAGLGEQTLEEYLKEQKEQREQKEKLEKEQPKSTASSSKSTKSEKESEGEREEVSEKSSSKRDKVLQQVEQEEAVYDEEEEKIIAETKKKGYCYFRKEMSQEERTRDFTPKAVSSSAIVQENESNKDNTSTTVTSSSKDSAVSVPQTESGKVTASSWNHAGTWEERDVTDLVKKQLEELFLSAETSLGGNQWRARVTKIDKFEGEAQIVITRGKKRHLYEFSASVYFSVEEKEVGTEADTEAESKAKAKRAFTGKLSFPDISYESSLDYSIKWKKKPTEADPSLQKTVETALEELQSDLKSRLMRFDAEYRAL